jgi:hypothetical protein
MQQFLKSTRRTAGARIVAAQLLQQFLVAVDNALTADSPLYARFRRESLLAFLSWLETKRGLGVVAFS